MSTLLLRLAGPLQSWGTDSKFEVRRTENEPSKSGVIGLVAAALGIRRNEEISELNSLRMGVRVDQEGKLMRDFHTAHSEKNSYITTRYYLADAVFLVGLESQDEELLKKIEFALKHPAFPLFLGRKSCPPEAGLVIGIRSLSLENALEQESWQGASWRKQKMPAKMRTQIECEPDDIQGVMIKDRPVSYNFERRKYGYRRAKQRYAENTQKRNPAIWQEHDAMGEL